MSDNKNRKEAKNNEISKMSDSISHFLGDMSGKSATKQIALGSGAGFVTGIVTSKVGRVAAIALGSGIILFQIANDQGYIKVDWSKINKNFDRAADKVHTTVSGESTKWLDKAERFVDRKLDEAEDVLKKKQKKVKRWYHSLTGDENGVKLNETHVFLISFAAGVCIGIGAA